MLLPRTADFHGLSEALEQGGTLATPSFGATGNITYGLTLVPGSYAVRFDANPALCTGTHVSHIPC
jgi:hypothetical protein